jgi:hypothetical protein
MSNKTPSQQRYFDYSYELYHFNPFHDKMGRFASSSTGARGYVGRNGKLTPKAIRRLNAASDSNNNNNNGNGGNGGGGDNNKNNNNNNNGGKIKIDKNGRVAPEDQDKAISEIEKQISKDWSNKSSVLSNSSKLLNDVGKFREKNRNRTAKTKAAGENLTEMSNDDLKKYIDERTERMSLERKYREIKEAEYNRGRAKVDDVLETAGTILALGATAATIAATIHTLKS